MMKKATLAICAPGLNVYSETFIRAHKTLPYNVKYYYNSFLPFELEGEGILAKFDLASKLRKKFARQFNYGEHDLRASFRKHKIDCVLAEYGPTACKILKVVKSLGLPMIVHFHGYDATEISTINYYGGTYKEVFEYCHRVIVVSSKMYQDLKKLGCPDEKLLLNIYGPDDSFYNSKPAFNRPQFLAVGRFVDKKAPYLTLAAFKEIVNDFPDAKLVFVGDGPLMNACRNLAKAWDLTNNVEFKGPASPAEVKALIEQSLAFVQHSIIADNLDSEGTPVAILEAQAAGLPVLSTFHAGIPEVVLNNETGLLVQEGDFKGMARNMRQLLKDFTFAKKLGVAGKERIRNNFTISRHLGTLQTEIDNALIYAQNY